MPDDKAKKGPADAARININEEYEVRYWSEKFRCTPDQLRGAVKVVGVMAEAVRQQLAKQ